MALALVENAGEGRTGALLLAALSEQGSAAHPYSRSPVLLDGPDSARNLADAVHLLSTLHGRQPGVIDHATGRTFDAAARGWLISAAEAFAAERFYLGRLAVAAGPVPGTPGGSGSEATVMAQRNAVATLACSERDGCAFGAALALAADWGAVRVVLDAAARRLGVDVAPCRLEDACDLTAIAGQIPAGTERAFLFGAQQMLAQHRGLWDLLEARQMARPGR